MSLKLSPRALMAQGAEHHFDAFAPHKLECRNKIAVRRDNNHSTNHFAQCQTGHVETNPNINALLVDVQPEVSIFQ